ncbi:prepilin-type N-terminal cleavage/methylation domain-containing protein [Salinimonas marina]|uniref:Prepilin-type N-terminal cleavage/methylation domain-containing protein n=1 Tax=Salinimonas marina TaxID=2785918 RepID=A0A7S9E004_9ALTE|nr:prepilin-type N-terminal cleavage/methylation domain-containing protein [Salinimonas marina]QPG06505.1 prepilin-type N-terminal cleavage/methylation domain-containing protein [Salinimonas marina]
MPENRKCSAAGFSLPELLITLMVLVLITQLAMPPLTRWQQENALRTQAQRLSLFLRDAQQLAITLNKPVYVISRAGNGPACLVIAYAANCPCTTQAPCSVRHSQEAQLFRGRVALLGSTYTPVKPLLFQALSGLSFGHAGSFVIGNGSMQIKLILNNLGRIRLCTPADPVTAIVSC